MLNRAYAKINLYLDVLGRFGKYTKIRTVLTEIDLYDELEIEINRSGKLDFFCDNPILENKENLVMKVAKQMKKRWNINLGASINLKKNIPISAGLGGGSSDAATAMLMLKKLWDIRIDKESLLKFAAIFGCDIPFFLFGGSCIGLKTGTDIIPIDTIEIKNILVVNPGIEISSESAYLLVDNYCQTNGWNKFLSSKDIRFSYNALQIGVEKKYPVIRQILKDMIDIGAINSILSGSGSSVIGFFNSYNELKKNEKIFKEKGFWTYKTKTKRRNNEYY